MTSLGGALATNRKKKIKAANELKMKNAGIRGDEMKKFLDVKTAFK